MKFRYPILGFLLILIFVFYLTLFSKNLEENRLEVSFENGKIIFVEVAKSPEEKSLGLMGREFLGEDVGMLFVYEEESVLSFWMKNTKIPLDIIFLNKDREIVMIKTMTPCITPVCENYSSELPSMYAIEVNSGFAEKNDILIGQKLDFRL